jgi:hypothetical protein
MLEVNSIDLFRIMLSDDPDIISLFDTVHKNPYKSLYFAVILQAILDTIKPQITEEDSLITIHRGQAHSWIFASVGVTCENFEDTCTFAGIEPHLVREFTQKTIDIGDVENVRRNLTSLL